VGQRLQQRRPVGLDLHSGILTGPDLSRRQPTGRPIQEQV
jgi:hypothetical protein